MRFARQRDANEGAIVRALVAVGASVSKLNETGIPDLLVGLAGATYLLEVKRPSASGRPKRTQPGRRLQSEAKTDERGLLDSQQKWWAAWRGAPPVVVTTPAQALAAIGWRGAREPEGG